MKRLPQSFFRQKSLVVAQEILGKYLVCKVGGKLRIGKIVETESYPGPYDRASHAFGFKKTPRNQIEYRAGGYAYIYLVYGMYWQLNITTGRKGYPESVLIRALEPHSFLKSQLKNRASLKDLANGPGKLCRWLAVNKSFYGEDMTTSKRLWVGTRGRRLTDRKIACGARIGIDYAGPRYAAKPWRFWIEGNPCVSA